MLAITTGMYVMHTQCNVILTFTYLGCSCPSKHASVHRFMHMRARRHTYAPSHTSTHTHIHTYIHTCTQKSQGRIGAASEAQLDNDSGPPPEPVYGPETKAVKRLLFGLVFMHACVQVGCACVRLLVVCVCVCRWCVRALTSRLSCRMHELMAAAHLIKCA
jgi:hypothetical protein